MAYSRRLGCALLIVVALVAGTNDAEAQAGGVHVHDGDTMTIEGQRWRVWGIDAPELGQQCIDAAQRITPCGEYARTGLVELIGHSVPYCILVGRSFDRLVGRCYVGEVDLGASMVRAGLALDFERYSHGEYAGAERDARVHRRGIWAGSFDLPWNWRREQRSHLQETH